MIDTKILDEQYISHTYSRFPVEIIEGKGSFMYDVEGKEYIDLGSGIAVNIFGACDPLWVEAVASQLGKLQHTSNLYYTQPCTQLAKLLCEKTGAKKVFFGNSGAEANECAIKIARKYAKEKKGEDTYKIITLKNSFHGRTITTLAATGQDVFHNDFLPLTDGFIYAEANNIESVKNLVKSNKVAAIMFECVLGEGGVLTLEDDFAKGLYSLAKEEDILLICDEVQTGNGRCGEMYAYMHYGIQPDIVTTAKGLGGGLPIGACMMFDKTENVLKYGDHGSTFGGNPATCAGAISVVSRIDDKLLAEVKAKSDYIFKSLSGAKGVKSVSGMGLMIGIETEKDASLVINECMSNGVLVLKAKTKVRLLPPLNIPMELLERAIEVIKKACE
ncbi:MAG: aspartate aminotransferase family protein [Eubacteriales bacterium]|nr:aspartate aminotransferase family protein [Eubacteriales bacterium]